MIIDDFINVEKINLNERNCTKFNIKENNYALFTKVLERLDDFADHINSIQPRVNESVGGGVMAGLLVEEVFAKYFNIINRYNDSSFVKIVDKKQNNIYFILMKNNENMIFNLFFAGDGDYNKVMNTAKFPMRQNAQHNIGLVFNGSIEDVYNQIISFNEVEFIAFAGFNQNLYAQHGYDKTITQRGVVKDVMLIDAVNTIPFNDYIQNDLNNIFA